ncbi:MAG: hypothetical protein M3O50_13260 [Myxococcota bacterium]|nr:hypothetical protein [Myxococcota bacterium]
MFRRSWSAFLLIPSLFAASAAQAQTQTTAPATDPPPPSQADNPQNPTPPQESKEDVPSPTHESKGAAVAPPTKAAAKPVVNPWFVRTPYEMKLGEGKEQWKLQVYGFAEADFMADSTRSFADGQNAAVIARNSSANGNNTRLQFTARNSRFGFKAQSPEVGGIKPTGVLEFDFFGYDPAPYGTPTNSEAGFFNNPTLRIRHANIKLESEAVDFLFGQMYHLFGWQNYFFGASAAFLGLPNQVFGRTQQARVSHTFKGDAVNVDVALGAFRPVQRDSATPDGEAGVRLMVNNWKAINTPGNGGTAAYPAAIGVSGLVRKFKVNSPVGNVVTTTPQNSDVGWGLAIDALIPIIPAEDSTDRGNALTLNAEYSRGSGYADQFTGMTAGATFPAAGGSAGPPMVTGNTSYVNVDNGLVAYDAGGALHTIDFQTFWVGLQYYLPPSGRVLLAANYTHADSKNIADLLPTQPNVYKESNYVDGTVFFDVTPAARLGLSYQYTKQNFTDGTSAQNNRYEALALYFF